VDDSSINDKSDSDVSDEKDNIDDESEISRILNL
jgi:hypothetical protein